MKSLCQTPLEQAHEYRSKPAILTSILGHDHLRIHTGGLRSMRKPRGDGGFLRRWPHACARASFTLGARDPAVNGALLVTVITYPKKCSPWEESSGFGSDVQGRTSWTK